MPELNGLFLDWQEHCHEAGAKQAITSSFNWLSKIYSDKSRFYSNLALLSRLFGQIHKVERQHPVSLAVKFAIWTHALVVRPTEERGRVRKQNMQEARHFLVALMFDRELLDRVSAILSFCGAGGEDELFFSDLLFSELAPLSFSEFQEREDNRAMEFVEAYRHLGRSLSLDQWRVVRYVQFSFVIEKRPFFKTPHFALLEPFAERHINRFLSS